MTYKLTEDQNRFLEKSGFHLDKKDNKWWQFDGSLDRVLLVAGMISLQPDDKIRFVDLRTGKERSTINKVPYVYTYGISTKLLDVSRDADSKNEYVREAINMITSLTGDVASYLKCKEVLFVLDWL